MAGFKTGLSRQTGLLNMSICKLLLALALGGSLASATNPVHPVPPEGLQIRFPGFIGMPLHFQPIRLAVRASQPGSRMGVERIDLYSPLISRRNWPGTVLDMLPLPGSASAHPAAARSPCDRVKAFWRNALPTRRWLILFPWIGLYSLLSAWLVARLKLRRRMETPYTRKIFHFLIFSFAGILQIVFGLNAVVLLGITVSSIVLYAVVRGAGFPLYEALARPADSPHRTLFVLIPLFTTALGGIFTNLFFPEYAVLGYWICGWGDAIGEPVGARWGEHRYRVPSFAGVRATRTLEGSAAVFAATVLISFVGLLIYGVSVSVALQTALLCGVAVVIVEAISTHGLDNFTIQAASVWFIDSLLS